MNTNYPLSQQQLRAMALKAQLLAVDAQAAALRSMDREHTFGIESTYTVDRIHATMHDFMSDIFTLVGKADKVEIAETRSAISVMVARAKELKREADELKERGARNAQFRYNLTHGAAETLKVSAETPKTDNSTAVEPLPAAPVEPLKLQDKADFACLRAEVDEYMAFAMQVHALCNLALEYSFSAAVTCSRCQSNI